ncbi:S-layer homology domain-containing protein, partial [Bifidobacterium callitrichidarum]
QYADGVFGTDLYAKYGKLTNNGYEFTGWYTSPDAGGQAVDPNAKLNDGDTLYAHWAYAPTDESEAEVTFNLYNATSKSTLVDVRSWDPDGASKVVEKSSDNKTVTVKLADGDEVADWQVPSKDWVSDGWVFKGWDSEVSSAVRGTTLNALADPGLTVTVSGATAYKDGDKVDGQFDVAREANVLDGVQLVTGQADANGNNGNSVKLAYSFKWAIPGSGDWKTVEHGQSLAIPTGVGSIKVEPVAFQNATEYVVHPVSVVDPTYNKYYFTNANSSFVDAYGQEKLDDLSPRVNNDAFLGWYDKAGTFTVNGTSERVVAFFDINQIKKQSEWDRIAPNTVPTFDFANQYGQGVVNVFAGYDASAKYVTVNLKPLYDQAKTISVKLYTDKTVAEQLDAVAPARDGYSIEGYYTKVDSSNKPIQSSKVSDADTVATLCLLSGDDVYVNYSADSKYGVNGLLYNLSRGYATSYGPDKKDGKNIAHFDATKVPGVTSYSADKFALADGFSGAKKVSVYSTDTDGKFLLAKPAGYTDASWKDYNATRNAVVKELLQYFKLSADKTTIADVYNAVATKLSAEKADEINQEFGGKLVANTSYPDVNYDDYGTHADEISYLTTKGIVKGYADGTFGYGAPLARVDYIVWLYRAAGSPAVSSEASFSDVNATTVPNKEFRDAIAWAASEGITKGYADGTFAPYATLNRQDAAAFLYRAAGSPKFNESYADVKFSDVTPGDSAN